VEEWIPEIARGGDLLTPGRIGLVFMSPSWFIENRQDDNRAPSGSEKNSPAAISRPGETSST